MKALLLNDFLIMKKNYTVFYYASMVFAVICSSLGDAELRMYTLSIFIFLTTAISATQMKASNMGFLDSFPFSKKLMVSEKYLLLVFATIVNIAVATVSTILRYFFIKQDFHTSEIAITVFMLALSVFVSGINNIIALRFRADVALFIHICSMGMLCGSTARYEADSGYSWIDMDLAFFAAMIAIIVFLASWLISTKAYKKRKA